MPPNKFNYPQLENIPADARWLKAWRVKLGIKQAGLAEMLGVSLGTVSGWENKGLPRKGAARQAIEGLIEKLREEQGISKKIEIPDSGDMTRVRK
jgi:transcriptional regulator with XRE-family HTH domain